MAFVLLASLEELINSKCFFHFEGRTKKIGRFKAAHIPLIAPKVWPKLNMLVTPWPGIAVTCSIITLTFSGLLSFKCLEISDFTGFDEILDGRVKTLHPKIHAGILNKRNNKSHLRDIKNNRF